MVQEKGQEELLLCAPPTPWHPIQPCCPSWVAPGTKGNWCTDLKHHGWNDWVGEWGCPQKQGS